MARVYIHSSSVCTVGGNYHGYITQVPGLAVAGRLLKCSVLFNPLLVFLPYLFSVLIFFPSHGRMSSCVLSRPLSAYQCFFRQIQADIRKQHPKVNSIAIMMQSVVLAMLLTLFFSWGCFSLAGLAFFFSFFLYFSMPLFLLLCACVCCRCHCCHSLGLLSCSLGVLC